MTADQISKLEIERAAISIRGTEVEKLFSNVLGKDQIENLRNKIDAFKELTEPVTTEQSKGKTNSELNKLVDQSIQLVHGFLEAYISIDFSKLTEGVNVNPRMFNEAF